MNTSPFVPLVWQRSPASGASGNCPEYADLPYGGKAIRNSSTPDQVVVLSESEWLAMKADIQSHQVS